LAHWQSGRRDDSLSVAKAIASGTLGYRKCSIQFSTVKYVYLDAHNSMDNVRAILDDWSVLVDWVDRLHCAIAETKEASQRRNI